MKYLDKKYVTRFAPSLTGDLHFGNIRIALLNWFIALKSKGLFILRFEDSNLINKNKRFTVFSMLKTLRYLNITWGRGVFFKDEESYFQSNRRLGYVKYLRKLNILNRVFIKRNAFWLLVTRKVKTLCVNYLNKLDVCSKVFNFIVFKKNLKAVFNFVNPIDDIDMGVNLVVRGVDHIDNSKKHSNLFYLLNKPIPKFIHVPLILIKGNLKMTKRSSTHSLSSFLKKNYLKETICDLLLYSKDPSIKNIKGFFKSLAKDSNISIDERFLKKLNNNYLSSLNSKNSLFYMFNYFKLIKRSSTKDLSKKNLIVSYINKKDVYTGFIKERVKLVRKSFKPCCKCISFNILSSKVCLLRGLGFFKKLKSSCRGSLNKRLFLFKNLRGVNLIFMCTFYNKKITQTNLINKLKLFLYEHTYTGVSKN